MAFETEARTLSASGTISLGATPIVAGGTGNLAAQ
jgi:hypothetical protein